MLKASGYLNQALRLHSNAKVLKSFYSATLMSVPAQVQQDPLPGWEAVSFSFCQQFSISLAFGILYMKGKKNPQRLPAPKDHGRDFTSTCGHGLCPYKLSEGPKAMMGGLDALTKRTAWCNAAMAQVSYPRKQAKYHTRLSAVGYPAINPKL